MLADFVKAIAKMATDSATGGIIKCPDLPDVVFQRDQAGTITTIDVPPPRRDVELASIDDLAKFVKTAPAPEVFYDRGGVTVILDRGERRDFASMTFNKARKFTTLQALEAGWNGDLKGILRRIRFDLHGLPEAQAARAALSSLKFSTSGTTTAVVKHGEESLGKSVDAKVTGSGEIPESFTVNVPVFCTEGLQEILAQVTVGINVDVHNETVELRTLPDEIETALIGAEQQAGNLLAAALGDGIPLFRGDPQVN